METRIVESTSEYHFREECNALIKDGWIPLTAEIHQSHTPTTGWAKGVLCHNFSQTYYKQPAAEPATEKEE